MQNILHLHERFKLVNALFSGVSSVYVDPLGHAV